MVNALLIKPDKVAPNFSCLKVYDLAYICNLAFNSYFDVQVLYFEQIKD